MLISELCTIIVNQTFSGGGECSLKLGYWDSAIKDQKDCFFSLNVFPFVKMDFDCCLLNTTQ